MPEVVLASHWTTGGGGASPGLIFLLAAPYAVMAVAGWLLFRYLRRSGR